MTAARTARRLGACYPRAWCERYGEELEELIVLAAGGGSVDWNTRLDVLRGAARERARCALGLGPGGGPHERSREGVAAVLCAWAVFAVAGSVVAKTSEHWNEVMLGRVPVIATLGFDALRIAAVVTAAFVVVGMLVALPAALELLRREGLAAHRRPPERAGRPRRPVCDRIPRVGGARGRRAPRLHLGGARHPAPAAAVGATDAPHTVGSRRRCHARHGRDDRRDARVVVGGVVAGAGGACRLARPGSGFALGSTAHRGRTAYDGRDGHRDRGRTPRADGPLVGQHSELYLRTRPAVAGARCS
jgi:hypothetical protein